MRYKGSPEGTDPAEQPCVKRAVLQEQARPSPLGIVVRERISSTGTDALPVLGVRHSGTDTNQVQ